MSYFWSLLYFTWKKKKVFNWYRKLFLYGTFIERRYNE